MIVILISIFGLRFCKGYHHHNFPVDGVTENITFLLEFIFKQSVWVK